MLLGTMSQTFAVMYLRELILKCLEFTFDLVKSIWDLKLQLTALGWKISFIIVTEKLFFILRCSIASDWIFLCWILNNLSNSNNFSNDETIYFYTIRRALSWIWFIFEFTILPWKIHVNGQYLNCDLTNSLSNIFLFSKLI